MLQNCIGGCYPALTSVGPAEQLDVSFFMQLTQKSQV
jgi:hypothetical protein